MWTLQGYHLPLGLRADGFTAGYTALKVVTDKVTKHGKLCMENQHVFIPFTFDTFGFLVPDAVMLLNRVQQVMHNNVISLKFMDAINKMIGFTIQKGLAAPCYPFVILLIVR